MALAANTSSTLSLPDGTNKTSVGLSTNIIILVNNTAVGAVQTLQITENRPIAKVSEIGTDGVIDSSPNQSTNVSGSCARIRFDRLRITEAFSRGFLHAAAQVYPFDIVILDKQKRDLGSQISTVIKNVWIRELSYSYQVNDWLITDNMQFEAETIFSVLNGGTSPISGGVPAAVGGERGIVHANLPIEQITDTGSGGRRGSLDASGLIDLGSDGTVLF